MHKLQLNLTDVSGRYISYIENNASATNKLCKYHNTLSLYWYTKYFSKDIVMAVFQKLKYYNYFIEF